MALKTRDILVDVARRLFAEKGVENTTMNDIALASQKGRRTLYTYFKSKDEVYYAVVERELLLLANRLDEVVKKDVAPDIKLIEYIYARLDAIKNVVLRNGDLKSDFFNNITMVERVRRKLDFRERSMIKSILQEGVNKGIFTIKDTDFAALMVHSAVKGMEVPYIRGEIEAQMNASRDDVTKFLYYGLKR